MHAVYKPSSATTKLRMVFDASAKSKSGTSLNDILMIGPTVYPPLIDILLRFKLQPIALTANIPKMYRVSTALSGAHIQVKRSRIST